MAKNKNQAIENAEEIIEAFGGIRPMAKKIDVAVTTVQGWKKRNVIPATRIDQIIKAAQEHDVDLDGILNAVANENVVAVVSIPKSKVLTKSEAVSVEAVVDHIDSEDDLGEGDIIPEEIVIPSKPTRSVKADDAEEKILRNQMDEIEHSSVSRSLVFVLIASLLIALGFVAVAAYFWQKSEADKAEMLKLQAIQQQQLSEAEAQDSNVTDSQGFLGQIIPKDLNAQIASLQNQAKDMQVQLGTAAQQMQEAADVISKDVLAEDAGNLEQRLAKLEEHLQDMTGQPVLAGVLARIKTFQMDDTGQDVLAQTVAELDSLFSVMQDEGLNVDATGGEEAGLVNQVLNEARTQSVALGQTFSSVPQEDLKAAAMLLGLAQLRSSLNRDNQAFDSDLALLKKMVGEDNIALNEALDRLAPNAKEGVLTPTGLSNELRRFAGDAVAASLQGDDVSLQERAKARMNEVLQVEKDGELLSGTDTQASIARADQLLQSGDIAGAIASVEGVDGDAAQVLAPWLNKAQASLYAQKAKDVVTDMMNAPLSGGQLIYDEAAGINIYVPASSVPVVGGME